MSAHSAAADGRAVSPRLHIVGGFLGAGKTTALLRLAEQYHAEGLRVALITNDQAADLVDTGSVRLRGFRVAEVAGACFCCKFDDLAEKAEALRQEQQPDVILGEPVGSCTDLAATVVTPFRRLYGDRYSVAPYSVLVDPVRARQIVLERGFGGFSQKVAYIFLKQLEEADVICLNKADLLQPQERERALAALAAEFPQARVLATSGITGAGFSEWRALLGAAAEAGRNFADVDYDVYAEGEAELGWLNLALDVRAAAPFDAGALDLALVRAMSERFAAHGAEVAHLKVLVEGAGGAAVANTVGAGSAPRLSSASGIALQAARVVINARVHTDPAVIRAAADAACAEVFPQFGIAGLERAAAQFRPGRPVPIHRDSVAP